MPRLRTVLIANRGEIVARVARSCRNYGLRTVAIFSDADEDAPFVATCDAAVRIGGRESRESYLDVAKIIDAALASGADAIHPGFGFLSENPALPRACGQAGITFIGPSAEVMAQLGSKVVAKRLARDAGVPVIPGYQGDDQSPATLAAEARALGCPVLVKASAGGGGKGMRIVRDPGELDAAIAAARREATSAFGDPTLLIERYIDRPRHIEIQILADTRGNVVHLGERECSIQRRHQKIVEEAPSPAVTPDLRARMGDAAVALARSVGYHSAGTVEFVLAPDGQFYFLEVNTRLQVEHPVTEEITGVDIVTEQLRVAEGEALGVLEPPPLRGHAIECRLYAEDPDRDFLPQSGALADWRVPDLEGLRVEAALAPGAAALPYYDPMLAKVVTVGDDRARARARMERALAELFAPGVATNQDFLARIMAHPAFASGEIHTHFVAEHALELTAPADGDGIDLGLTAINLFDRETRRHERTVLPALPLGYSNNRLGPERISYRVGEEIVELTYEPHEDGGLAVTLGGEREVHVRRHRCEGGTVFLELGTGACVRVSVASRGPERFAAVHRDTAIHVSAVIVPRFPDVVADVVAGGLTAPMPSKVIAIHVEVGQRVSAGDTIAVLEAMKMEHQMRANATGVITSIDVTVGDQLETGQLLVVITADQAGQA